MSVAGLAVGPEPREGKRVFLESAMNTLAPGKPFVQFSYSNRSPLPQIDGVEVARAATVWQNIWPMRIWVYRRLLASNG
jgi:phosphatidylethanolamine/phosphatidyl-N-methylethanolamine N-methyltransferase